MKNNCQATQFGLLFAAGLLWQPAQCGGEGISQGTQGSG
jgi:hypothetical protein